jgi:alkaline phosphatase
MKLRNRLLAVFCLLVFAAGGWLYVREWVVQKPFAIILFVSDGLTARHLTAARLYEKGAAHRLAIESFPHVALLRNPARDFAVPDDAAAATALATGATVAHRTLSNDPGGRELRTILDHARRHGRSIGLVSTGSLAGPGAAAFYAHSTDSRDRAASAAQLPGPATLDVVLGGGAGDFLPEAKGGRRTDGRDLLAELQGAGWHLVRTKAELANAPAYRTASLAGFFSQDALAFSDQIESGSQQPALADMVRRAIEFLQIRGSKGYVLIVDASLVSTAAERNEGERVLTETLALDRAIRTATEYAGAKSLILAVGKHGTGGLSLNGYPLVTDRGVGLLGVNAAGQPALTWATGPNGPAARSEPAAFLAPSALNTVEDVLAIGEGDGAEKLRGFLNNTDIFRILREAL